MRKFSVPEYILHLAAPMTNTNTVSAATNSVSNTTNWTGTLFIPARNQTINRVAFRATALTSFSGTAVAGITSVTSSGTIDTFIGSGTTTVPSAEYHIASFSDVAVTAGTPYYAAVRLESVASGTMTVMSSLANTPWSGINSWPHYQTGASTLNYGQGAVLYGYNNGTETQWYGMPFYSVTGYGYNIGTETGAKIELPPIFGEYRVRAVNIVAVTHGTHGISCKIYKADGTTQVENASASFQAGEKYSNGPAKYCLEFGGVATLYPGTTYFIAVEAVGGVTPGSSLYCTRVSSTTVALNNFNSCFDVKNVAYTKSGTTYTYYNEERAQIDLILDSFYSSSRRGSTGPVQYHPQGESLKLWLEGERYQSYPRTGASWYDLSGNGYHFTGTTDATWSTVSGSFTVPDSNNKAWTNSSLPNTIWNSSDFTVLTWARPSITYANTTSLYIFSTGTTEANGLGLYYVGSTTSRMYITTMGSTQAVNVSIGTTTTNSLFCAVRYHNSTKQLSFYEPSIGSSSIVTLSNSLSVTGTSCAVGGASWDLTNTRYSGSIGNLIVYNRALSDTEIKDIYNATIYRFGLGTTY